MSSWKSSRRHYEDNQVKVKGCNLLCHKKIYNSTQCNEKFSSTHHRSISYLQRSLKSSNSSTGIRMTLIQKKIKSNSAHKNQNITQKKGQITNENKITIHPPQTKQNNIQSNIRVNSQMDKIKHIKHLIINEKSNSIKKSLIQNGDLISSKQQDAYNEFVKKQILLSPYQTTNNSEAKLSTLEEFTFNIHKQSEGSLLINDRHSTFRVEEIYSQASRLDTQKDEKDQLCCKNVESICVNLHSQNHNENIEQPYRITQLHQNARQTITLLSQSSASLSEHSEVVSFSKPQFYQNMGDNNFFFEQNKQIRS